MDEALWALGRGTGIVGLALMTISVVLGILTRSGRPAFGMPRFAVTLVHRNASLLGTVFILIHIVSLLFDPYAQLDVVDFFVPFLGDYSVFWLGLGTVAFDLLLAIIITALLRNRIGPRLFKAVHWGTYAMWPIALAHSLGTGTDAFSTGFLVFAGLCTAAVAGALIWRLSARFTDAARTPLAGEVAAVPLAPVSTRVPEPALTRRTR